MSTDSSTTRVSESVLREIGERTRRWRLSGDHFNESETPLVGKCFDNAYVCYKLLERNGYEPTLIEGTTTRLLKSTGNKEMVTSGVESIESVTDVLESVHYWVGVNVDKDMESWMIDVASDTENQFGEIVVSNTISPTGYHVFSDSISEGEKTLQMVEQRGDRCMYCGGNKYEHGGCPQCYVEK